MIRVRARTAVAVAVTSSLASAVALVAGCSSPPSCEQAVQHAGRLRHLDPSDVDAAIERCVDEGWPAALRTCIHEAGDGAALSACAARPRATGAIARFDDYLERSRRAEAELRLKHLEKALKFDWAEDAAFPPGQAGPTPAAGSCCAHPDHRCPPTASLWAGDPVWEALDFEVTEPGHYSYAYRAEDGGRRAVVEASADLDCDGELATFTLRCEVVDDEPRCTLTPPARAD